MDTSLCESPLERAFYTAYCKGPLGQAKDAYTRIIPQKKIDRYRLDFLITLQERGEDELACAVEIDGHAFHEKTKEQARRDKKRDRELLTRGIPVVRFTGSEVFANPEACAAEAWEALIAGAKYQ